MTILIISAGVSDMDNQDIVLITLLGSTPLATKWYTCMARTHWQIEVQALETLAMDSGWNSSLSM